MDGSLLQRVPFHDTGPVVERFGSLAVTAISGPGWTCTLATLVCTRPDALAPGASYPAITLNANVASNAASTLTNVATVAGGGATPGPASVASDTSQVGPLAGAELVAIPTLSQTLLLLLALLIALSQYRSRSSPGHRRSAWKQ